MTNPFQTAEAWDVSTETILGPGNHIVQITDCEIGTSSGASGGGRHPQIELKLSNPKGTIRDWLVVTESSIGKVVALANAAGVPLPDDDDIDPDESLRLKQVYLDRYVGQKVGIVVREEPDYKDPTRMRSRVQGYVDVDRIKESDFSTSDVTSAGATAAFAAPRPTTSEKELPF
jgi:hypothetical protein